MISTRFAIPALLVAAFGVVVALGQDAKPASKHAEGNDPGQMMLHENQTALATAAAVCATSCDTCASYCIDMLKQGKHEYAETLRSALDCATVCRAMASVAARGGPYSSILASACAEVCAASASLSEKMSSDPMMMQHSKACRMTEKASKDCCGAGPH